MKQRLVLLLLTPLLASAQSVEIGATAGGGIFGAEDMGNPGFGAFGAEFCAPCSHKVAAFAEFNHWENAGGGYANSRILSVNMIAAGVRFQGTGRVRGFVDAGIAGGWDEYKWPGGTSTHGNPGAVLGGGVAIPLGGKWYIRPQVRTYVLRGYHLGLAGMVGIGYRF